MSIFLIRLLWGAILLSALISGCASRPAEEIPEPARPREPAPAAREPARKAVPAEPAARKRLKPRMVKPVAAGIPLTAGYDPGKQRATASRVVLDLAQPPKGNYPVWVSGQGYPGLLRAATHQRIENDGYFGRGFSRFSPGNFKDGGRGEHYCGIGQIHGFDGVGDSSRMVVGMLIRFGKTFFTDQREKDPPYGDIKLIIFLKDSGIRPMMITKGNSRSRVIGACDGTTCNTTGSTRHIDYHNDGNHGPDLNRHLGQWLWVEYSINTQTPLLRVRTWSEDGSLKGAETAAPWGKGGRVTTLDIIGFVNSIPKAGKQPYYDLERVEFQVGSDATLGPPAGFPGSTR